MFPKTGGMVPSSKFPTSERTSSCRKLPKLVGMLPEKLFPERSRCCRVGISARAEGMGPTKKFWPRSRCWRFWHVEISTGRDELMALSYRERNERFFRRQRWIGKEPARLALERSTELTERVTELHDIPFHKHGVSSLSFQFARNRSGSSRLSLTRCKYSPSWFRQRINDGDEKRKKKK